MSSKLHDNNLRHHHRRASTLLVQLCNTAVTRQCLRLLMEVSRVRAVMGKPWHMRAKPIIIAWPFKDRKSRNIVSYHFSHNSTVDRASEVFEPSTDSAKTASFDDFFSVLGLGISGRDFTSVIAFSLVNFHGPGRQPNEPIFWLNFGN